MKNEIQKATAVSSGKPVAEEIEVVETAVFETLYLEETLLETADDDNLSLRHNTPQTVDDDDDDERMNFNVA